MGSTTQITYTNLRIPLDGFVFAAVGIDNPLEISFYAKACESQRWSVRELKRQKQTALFQRFALSKDKDGILELASRGIEVQTPEDVIRDPFVLEFAGLPELPTWKEKTLKDAIFTWIWSFTMPTSRPTAS